MKLRALISPLLWLAAGFVLSLAALSIFSEPKSDSDKPPKIVEGNGDSANSAEGNHVESAPSSRTESSTTKAEIRKPFPVDALASGLFFPSPSGLELTAASRQLLEIDEVEAEKISQLLTRFHRNWFDQAVQNLSLVSESENEVKYVTSIKRKIDLAAIRDGFREILPDARGRILAEKFELGNETKIKGQDGASISISRTPFNTPQGVDYSYKFSYGVPQSAKSELSFGGKQSWFNGISDSPDDFSWGSLRKELYNRTDWFKEK